jgi:hypothetical protein
MKVQKAVKSIFNEPITNSNKLNIKNPLNKISNYRKPYQIGDKIDRFGSQYVIIEIIKENNYEDKRIYNYLEPLKLSDTNKEKRELRAIIRDYLNFKRSDFKDEVDLIKKELEEVLSTCTHCDKANIDFIIKKSVNHYMRESRVKKDNINGEENNEFIIKLKERRTNREVIKCNFFYEEVPISLQDIYNFDYFKEAELALEELKKSFLNESYRCELNGVYTTLITKFGYITKVNQHNYKRRKDVLKYMLNNVEIFTHLLNLPLELYEEFLDCFRFLLTNDIYGDSDLEDKIRYKTYRIQDMRDCTFTKKIELPYIYIYNNLKKQKF